jgi:hypothetical protein
VAAARPSSLRLLVHKSRSRTRTTRPRVVRGFRGLFSEPPPWPQAPRARGGAVMKRAGRVCSVGLGAARRALVAFRLRPASRPLPSWSALRLWAARPRLWFVRASRRRPLCPRARVVNKEAEASRGSWSVVSIVAPVLRAPASPSARARRVLGRVARGGPRRFFPEALAPGKARASGLFRFVGGRCHGPCFSPLANPRLGFAAPGSFGESRARQSAVQPSWRLGMRNGIS